MSNIDDWICKWCGKRYKYRGYLAKHVVECQSKNKKVGTETKSEVSTNVPQKKQKTESHNNTPPPISSKPLVDERDKSEIAPSLVSIINSMQECIEKISANQIELMERFEKTEASVTRLKKGNANNLLDIRELVKVRKTDQETIKTLEEEIENLTKKFEKLKDDTINSTTGYCHICWDNAANYAFTPCGHKAVCGTCAAQVLGAHRKCVLCRENVYDMIQIWDAGQKA